jgi:hypothetical protein
MPDEPNAETRKLLEQYHYDGDPEGQAVQFKHPTKHKMGHFINAQGDFKERPVPAGLKRGKDGMLEPKEGDADPAEPTEAQQQAVATGPVTTAGIEGPAPVDSRAGAEKKE